MDRVDETLAYLSVRVTEVETKLSTLTLHNSRSAPVDAPHQGPESHSTPLRVGESAISANEYLLGDSDELEQSGQFLTVPHRVILWPSVRQFLSDSGWAMTRDLESLSQQGTAWFLKCEAAKHPRSLPLDDGFIGLIPALLPGHELFQPGTSPPLTLVQAYEYSDMYFQTFNVLLPILEHDCFLSVLERLYREGYHDRDPDAVLALLVFALGKLATDGVSGEPIAMIDGFPSGFRGGNAEYPPGLQLFNQARRRLGFISSLCTLETAQISLLEGTYYGANARHLEFWKSTVSASMAIQVLMKCRRVEWATHAGDMISRVYWACLLQEDLYHVDLDLPKSGIHQTEDEVPLPSFRRAVVQNVPQPQEDGRRSHFQHHFLAMVALRRLITRIHNTIHEPSITQAESNEYRGIPIIIIYEMSRQLESWRSLLPKALQWLDDDADQFPDAGARNHQNRPLFSPERDYSPVILENNVDILTAQLRTRFYYARYLLYRPFIYKALHFPEQMTALDADYCALGIDSMCLWPLFMAPPRSKKRLVPHLYAWTQHIIGILLIIKLIQNNDTVRWICENKVDPARIRGTSTIMLDWIKDAKQIDGVADWSWTMLHFLFRMNSNRHDIAWTQYLRHVEDRHSREQRWEHLGRDDIGARAMAHGVGGNCIYLLRHVLVQRHPIYLSLGNKIRRAGG